MFSAARLATESLTPYQVAALSSLRATSKGDVNMITQEELKKDLSYNPDTGVFTWLKSKGRTTYKGKEAGWTQKNAKGNQTYRSIEINGKCYKAHRLAFLYMTGSMPNHSVDHIDGDGLNNKWRNLRDVSQSENQKNRPLQSNNKSGVIGVNFDKSKGKWVAAIGFNNKSKKLKESRCIGECILARKEAEKKYGFHENHGRK